MSNGYSFEFPEQQSEIDERSNIVTLAQTCHCA